MRNRRIFILSAVAGVFLGTHASADTVSSWLPGPGTWSTATQWSPPVVPNNTPTTKYDVVIPGGSFVPLDISATINSLSAAPTGGGGLFYATQGTNPVLTVVNNATIGINYLYFAALPIYPLTSGPGSLSVGGNLNVTSSSDEFVVDGPVSVGGNLTTGSSAMFLLNSSGNNRFTVGGTLTNQAGGTILLGNNRCQGGYCPFQYVNAGLVGGPATTAGNIVNNGSMFSWANVTTATLVNNGLTSIISGADNVGTLKNEGTLYLSNACCSVALEQTAAINVGAGASGSGYTQSAKGVLDEVLSGSSTYGRIIAGPWNLPNRQLAGYPVSLNGTLDVMLANGFVPYIGESFDILTTGPDDISGAFSNVTWDSFDNGRGEFVVDYHAGAGIVQLTAELKPVPEPATLFMIMPALGFAFWWIRRHRVTA